MGFIDRIIMFFLKLKFRKFNLSDGNWHFTVTTHDGLKTSYYIDGELANYSVACWFRTGDKKE